MSKSETTQQAYEDDVLRLYEDICAIKVEAPAFDADWERLQGEARKKRLHLIQKAFDAEWTKGYQQRKDEAL
jgi:hypothetical protein